MSNEIPVDLSVSGKDLGPVCPVYVDDFLGGTTLYNDKMTGAYMRLLLHQWSYGYIPRDLTKCQNIARSDLTTVELILAPDAPERPKFVLHSCGGLVNRKMAEVRNERILFIRDQRRKSALGLQARGIQPTGKPVGQPVELPKGCSPASPSPLPSPISEDRRALLSSSGKLGDLARQIMDARQEFKALQPMAIINCLRGADPATLDAHVAEFVADCANMMEPPRNPLGLLRGYLRGRPKPAQGNGYEKKQLGKSRLPNE